MPASIYQHAVFAAFEDLTSSSPSSCPSLPVTDLCAHVADNVATYLPGSVAFRDSVSSAIRRVAVTDPAFTRTDDLLSIKNRTLFEESLAAALAALPSPSPSPPSPAPVPASSSSYLDAVVLAFADLSRLPKSASPAKLAAFTTPLMALSAHVVLNMPAYLPAASASASSVVRRTRKIVHTSNVFALTPAKIVFIADPPLFHTLLAAARAAKPHAPRPTFAASSVTPDTATPPPKPSRKATPSKPPPATSTPPTSASHPSKLPTQADAALAAFVAFAARSTTPFPAFSTDIVPFQNFCVVNKSTYAPFAILDDDAVRDRARRCITAGGAVCYADGHLSARAPESDARFAHAKQRLGLGDVAATTARSAAKKKKKTPTPTPTPTPSPAAGRTPRSNRPRAQCKATDDGLGVPTFRDAVYAGFADLAIRHATDMLAFAVPLDDLSSFILHHRRLYLRGKTKDGAYIRQMVAKDLRREPAAAVAVVDGVVRAVEDSYEGALVAARAKMRLVVQKPPVVPLTPETRAGLEDDCVVEAFRGGRNSVDAIAKCVAEEVRVFCPRRSARDRVERDVAEVVRVCERLAVGKGGKVREVKGVASGRRGKRRAQERGGEVEAAAKRVKVEGEVFYKKAAVGTGASGSAGSGRSRVRPVGGVIEGATAVVRKVDGWSARVAFNYDSLPLYELSLGKTLGSRYKRAFEVFVESEECKSFVSKMDSLGEEQVGDALDDCVAHFINYEFSIADRKGLEEGHEQRLLLLCMDLLDAIVHRNRRLKPESLFKTRQSLNAWKSKFA